MLPVPVSVDIRLERERACMSTRSETNANPVLLATALTQRRTRSCAAMRTGPATKRCTPGGESASRRVGCGRGQRPGMPVSALSGGSLFGLRRNEEVAPRIRSPESSVGCPIRYQMTGPARGWHRCNFPQIGRAPTHGRERGLPHPLSGNKTPAVLEKLHNVVQSPWCRERK